MKIFILWLVAFIFVQNVWSQQSEVDIAKKAHTIFPLVFYTPETSVGTGVIWIANLWKVREGKNSYVQSLATVTARGQWIANITPRMYFHHEDQEVVGQLSYSYFPNQYYGNQAAHLSSPEKDIESNLNFLTSASQRISGDFFLRLFQQMRELKILQTTEGGLLEPQLLQNGFRNLRSKAFGISLEWDQRDFPQSPTAGKWVRLQGQKVWVEDKENQRSNSFYATELDARSYFQFENKLVLANQIFLGSLTDSEIPFQFLYFVGGTHALRGYYQGQYRDRNLVMNQNELRGAWSDKFGWSVFVAGAKLGDGARELSESPLRLAGGAGVSMMLDASNRIKLKLDLGVSQENRGIYMVLGEAF
jgi:hypothetical protein